MIDEFMHYAAERVRIFVCDSEACNLLVKSAIHGDFDRSVLRKLSETRFFSKLKYKEVPGMEILPNFGIRSCLLDDDPLYCMPGPAHATKNSAAQMMSSTKVLYFGSHFADASGTLTKGMALPAFTRRDPMSDRLCSLLSNPWCLANFETDGAGQDSGAKLSI